MKLRSELAKFLFIILATWLALTTTSVYIWQKQSIDGKGTHRFTQKVAFGNIPPASVRTTKASINSQPQKTKLNGTSSQHSTKPSKKFRETAKRIPGSSLVLDDIFITVKTSGRFHDTRLQILLKTWWNLAKNQTFIFTDTDDESLSNLTGGHLINTGCGNTHYRKDLCCKMGSEYDAFVESGKKWWCHFDDDNYVNVDVLLRILRGYDWESDYYVGKPSLSKPIEANYLKESVRFWFATGGAGMCISHGLSLKMSPWCRYGALEKTCNVLKLPDDCAIGFVVNNRLGVELTQREEFNSHLQILSQIRKEKLPGQASLSYYFDSGGGENIVNLDKTLLRFSPSDDPSRFYSFHCLLHPKTSWCR